MKQQESLLNTKLEPSVNRRQVSIPGKRQLEEITLSNGEVTVKIITLGAIITSIETPDRNGICKNIVAGFSQYEKYDNNPHYLGCVVGRYANRIAGGKLSIDGIPVQLSVNDAGNHLHGGFEGFNKKIWIVSSIIQDELRSAVTLTYDSPAGEEGYPGNLSVDVEYVLHATGSLYIHYEARTDRTTPVSLTNHSYFNLSGFDTPTIRDHVLQIYTQFFTEKNECNTPTGKVIQLAGMDIDLSAPVVLGERLDRLRDDGGYDQNYALWASVPGDTDPAAKLFDPHSGRTLQIDTDQPGIQVYTANLWDGSFSGSQGVPYQQHGAVALETQAFPDSPNQPDFPNTLLRPGEVYDRTTIYTFGIQHL